MLSITENSSGHITDSEKIPSLLIMSAEYIEDGVRIPAISLRIYSSAVKELYLFLHKYYNEEPS